MLSRARVWRPADFERGVGPGALVRFAAASGVAAPSGCRRERSRPASRVVEVVGEEAFGAGGVGAPASCSLRALRRCVLLFCFHCGP
eukprot:761947-Alexandrium_andersonii.AAC.1